VEQGDVPDVQTDAVRREEPESPDGLRYAEVEPHPVDEGVDRGLIRWLQSLTPAQRLETLR